MASDRHFLTGIDGIEGIWAEAPARFSYTSLTEAESCPRRWSLRRSAYPNYWSGSGYPERPGMAALMGEIVHRSLEAIIRALVAHGCTGPQDESAVPVMRSLGGYSEVIREAINERIRDLEDNPRCVGTIEKTSSELRQRSPEMRQATQALVTRSDFQPRRFRQELPAGSKRQSTMDRRLPDGSYVEMTLESTALRLTGRADLVTLAGRDVHIVDYKTGALSVDHVEQLQIYALLWSRIDGADPARPFATRLTASYPTCDVDVKVPTSAELEALEAQLRARLKNLASQLAENPPEARPDEQLCRYCSVRHMCDPYWRSPAFEPRHEGIGDLRGEVVEVSGPRTWTLRTNGGDMLLLGSDSTVALTPGSWVRILDGRVSPASTTDSAVVSLVSFSELYVERRGREP